MPVITVRDACFRYHGAREDALRQVSLEIEAGERVLLVGPTGSGKSTLLRLLMGVVPGSSGGSLEGLVEVAGCDSEAGPADRAARGVSLVAQDPAETFVADRVAAEVAFGPEGFALTGPEVDVRVSESLAAVGLADAGRRRVRELSGGEQQRVAIAAALALRPSILLLDEPTAHLDEPTAREILELIASLARDRGMTLVLAEHRLGIAARLMSRMVVVAGGAVVRDGDPRHVLADPVIAELGVPVPRATLAAVRLRLTPPVPLTPEELAARLIPDDRAGSSASSFSDPTTRSAAAAAAPLGPPPSTSGAAGRSRGSSSDDASRRPGLRFFEGDDADKPACQTPALRFVDVTFRYPIAERPAVRGVSFAIAQGERVALVGPTGSGKSTIARLALGLRRPSKGDVTLASMSTRTTPISRLAVVGGLVLQDPMRQLIGETVREEVSSALTGIGRAEARARVDQEMERFGLADLAGRHPLTLSEGERRRVVLAAAAVRRPTVLVLDEPTLGQDGRQRDRLACFVEKIAEAGSAVLVISHDPEFVNDACERALVIRDGGFVADLALGATAADAERSTTAGVPLADVPATVRLLGRAGWSVVARTVDELVASVATPELPLRLRA